MSEYGEPWRIKDPPGDGREIVDSSGEDVAGFDGVIDCASRIVACVNACAGIPSETLPSLFQGPPLVRVFKMTDEDRTAFIAECAKSSDLDVISLPGTMEYVTVEPKLPKALELLDLYFGPNEGIADRKEAFLLKHGWTKREGNLGSVTMGGATSTPLVWEWVKGDRVCFLATALAEEVAEQFRGLKA